MYEYAISVCREGSNALVKCDSLDLVFSSVSQIFHCWYTSPVSGT